MKLKVGSPAPQFHAESLKGNVISLDDYRNRIVLVKFYRFATCPVCNLHLRNFTRRYELLQQAGLPTIAIFHSPNWRLEKAIGHDLPFEMIADPEKRIFRSYGVQFSLAGMFSWPVMRDYMFALKAGYPAGMLTHDGGIKGHPADFIVGRGGKILYAHYGKDYSDSLSVDQVLPIVRQLKLEPVVNVQQFATKTALS